MTADRIIHVSDEKWSGHGDYQSYRASRNSIKSFYNEPANKFVQALSAVQLNFFEVMVSGHQLTDGDQLNTPLTGGQEKLWQKKSYQSKRVIWVSDQRYLNKTIVEDTFPGDVVDAEVVSGYLTQCSTVWGGQPRVFSQGRCYYLGQVRAFTFKTT